MQLALALSLLEVKDYQFSTPSQESRLQQPRERPNERSFPQMTLMERSRTQLPRLGSWPKVSSQQRAPETELEKETPETSQTVSRPPGSICKQDMVDKGNQVMDMRDSNQSVKPKNSKRKRQRKGVGQQVVGLPCSPSASPPVLLWFRRDLRLCDNPALTGSLEVGAPVIPVFIWSPEEEEGPGITVATGGACKSK